MNNKIIAQFFDEICKKNNVFVDAKASVYAPVSKTKLKKIFEEAYEAGFSDGLYEAQDKINDLLSELQP